VIAAELNRRFAVAPVLYGSLGLSRVLGVSQPVGDIDLLVPAELLGLRWPELQAALERLGFALADLREHEFRRAADQVAFAAEETLGPFAGVDPATLRLTTERGVQFRELSAYDFLAVYGASQHDGYRRDTRGKRDADKLAQIECFLAETAGASGDG
jgi:phosphoribosylanthranilate isomerase